MQQYFQKSCLQNGIRVLSEKMDGIRSVTIGVWILTGSRYDPVEYEGIAHFLEHMVFKGTKTRTAYDIACSLEAVGGHLNAFTEKEFTVFYAHVLEEHMELAIDLLSDIVLNSINKIEDIKNEKQIVIEEIQNLEDTPEDLIQDLFVHQVFQNHALGRSILGTRNSIERINRDSIESFKNKYYTAQNIIVSCAGNVEHKKLVQIVDTAFQNTSTAFSMLYEPVVVDCDSIPESFHMPVSQVHYCLGTTGVGFSDPRKHALICLNTLIGGGMSSRLFQNLREKNGLAYSVYSLLDFWSDTGLWGIYSGTSANLKEQLLSRIDDELTQIARGHVTHDELNLIKGQLTGNLILAAEDSTTVMDRLVRLEYYQKHYQDLQKVKEKIEKVTLDDIVQMAHELFEQQQYRTIIEPD